MKIKGFTLNLKNELIINNSLAVTWKSMFRFYLTVLVGIVPLFQWINRLLLYGLAIFRARLSGNLIKYTLINLRRGARCKDQLQNFVNSSFTQHLANAVPFADYKQKSYYENPSNLRNVDGSGYNYNFDS